MNKHKYLPTAAAAAVCALCAPVWAADASFAPVSGTLNSTLTLGAAARAQSVDCRLVGDTTSSCGASANQAQWAAGDDGGLNYQRGDLFTRYVKGSHELVLNLRSDVTFMARGSWLRDWGAD